MTDMREEFEKFVDEHGCWNTIMHGNSYVCEETAFAWEAWRFKESEIKALRDAALKLKSSAGFACRGLVSVSGSALSELLKALGENSNG